MRPGKVETLGPPTECYPLRCIVGCLCKESVGTGRPRDSIGITENVVGIIRIRFTQKTLFQQELVRLVCTKE